MASTSARLGIFARTFPGREPAAVLAAAAAAGFGAVQYNMACSGLSSLPTELPREALRAVREAQVASGVGIVALSATWNMTHPDPVVRAQGLAGLEVLAPAARALDCRLLTLCTGSRNAADQWAAHPDNGSDAAWSDFERSLEAALAIAERHDVTLGIEPEPANVVSGVDAALRALAMAGPDRLGIVLDPANLYEHGEADAVRRLVADAVDRLGGRVELAHAKDRDAAGRVVAAGRGVVDFPDFVSRLAKAGYAGPVVTHGLEPDEAPGVAAFLAPLLEHAA